MNFSSLGSISKNSKINSLGMDNKNMNIGSLKNIDKTIIGKGKKNENENEKKSDNKSEKKPVTEFGYFRSKFLILVIVTNIVFYINRYIAKEAKNINSYNYNTYMLYAYLIYIATLVFDIMTYESEHTSKMVNIICLTVLTIFGINWALIKYYNKGFWINLFLSLAFCFLIYGLFLLGAYVGIISLGKEVSDPLFFMFNYAFETNYTFFKLMYVMFPIILICFASWNYNTKLSQLINQNIMGFFNSFLYVMIFFIIAVKVRLLNKKQILNTIISYQLVLYVFSIVGTYVGLQSIKDACQGLADTNNSKKDADLVQLIRNLILISIIIMLILNDVRKWSFFNYLSYLLITAFVIFVFFGLTTKYPSISLFSLWSVTEWFILTTYNTHDTGNSFSFVMMNHKYNLASTNKEGSV